MLSAFSSTEMIVSLSIFTIVFILGFLGYLGWKLFKLSGHKPNPGEKVW